MKREQPIWRTINLENNFLVKSSSECSLSSHVKAGLALLSVLFLPPPPSSSSLLLLFSFSPPPPLLLYCYQSFLQTPVDCAPWFSDPQPQHTSYMWYLQSPHWSFYLCPSEIHPIRTSFTILPSLEHPSSLCFFFLWFENHSDLNAPCSKLIPFAKLVFPHRTSDLPDPFLVLCTHHVYYQYQSYLCLSYLPIPHLVPILSSWQGLLSSLQSLWNFLSSVFLFCCWWRCFSFRLHEHSYSFSVWNWNCQLGIILKPRK